jgi:acyl-CoA thioesterase I
MTGPARCGRLGAILAAMLAAGLSAAGAFANCAAPAELMTVGAELDRAAARIDRDEALRILALGSSSTLGVGASSSGASYPSRLEAELKARFPKHDIRVVNRGVGGEDAPEELARLGPEVARDRPDLVIWQVGTNAVLRRDDLAADDRLIGRGVQLLKNRHVDVVLMDLQYAPRVISRRAYSEMERRIAAAARQAHVGLFRRFAIMQHWGSTHAFDGAAMIGRDGLHMTDASYACLAADLADALARSWRLRRRVAPPPRAASGNVAGLGPPRVAPAAGLAGRR